MIGGCLLICVPALVSDFLFRNKTLAINDKEFRSTFSCYLNGFRIKANIINLMFYPIYMFRRLVFAFTIVILTSVPELQLAFIAVGTCCVILFITLVFILSLEF